MRSNSLPDADLNLPETKTKSPSCPSGGVHMYGSPSKHMKWLLIRIASLRLHEAILMSIHNLCF